MNRFAPRTQQAANQLGDRQLADAGFAREIIYRRPCEPTRTR